MTLRIILLTIVGISAANSPGFGAPKIRSEAARKQPKPDAPKTGEAEAAPSEAAPPEPVESAPTEPTPAEPPAADGDEGSKNPPAVPDVFSPSPKAKSRPKKGPKSPTLIVDQVAAVVNGVVILESEVAERAIPELSELGETQLGAQESVQKRRQIMRTTLDMMVDEELMVQAAKDAQLDVSDDEVETAIKDLRHQNQMSERQFKQALKQQGFVSYDDYKDRVVKKQMLRMRAINILVRPRVQVSDDEVRSMYERMVGKASEVSEVRVAHILVAPPEGEVSENVLEELRRRAGDLVSRARAGESFEELAKQHSQDDGTKEQGGSLGWFRRGELPTEWEEILFAMEQNEVRGPVRGPRGLHVFKLMDLKKESHRPFDEVKSQLQNQLYSEALEKQSKIWLEELRRKAHVEIKL